MTMNERLALAEMVLREFAGDVEAVSATMVRQEWPDLWVTYAKAKQYFEETER